VDIIDLIIISGFSLGYRAPLTKCVKGVPEAITKGDSLGGIP
jgi:hypothetical protein